MSDKSLELEIIFSIHTGFFESNDTRYLEARLLPEIHFFTASKMDNLLFCR